MCGLIFAFNPGLDPEDLKSRVRGALEGLAHRGPDASGIAAGSGYVMGHRRLSIIDVESSAQPMMDHDGRHVIAYNGEIYNFRHLRDRLESRWTFRTVGDTEVLLAGLLLEGPRFLEAVEGMWALALWDRREQSLFLARDRMGEKPLYYYADNSLFVAASELPSLLRLLPDIPAEDLDSTADFFRYGYFLPGTTAYSGVREVLPAHWLTWSPRTGTKGDAYWNLKIGTNQSSREEIRGRLREVLTTAVRRRLIADVEVGAFLSGGVDSSLVVALAAQVAGQRPKTFTIGFRERAFDERAYARIVSQHIGTDHREEVLTRFDPDELSSLVLHHVGQPFGDSSILPTALVSRLASRHIKVALSGDGGDELFCGYQRYLGRVFLRWYTRLPALLRQPVERQIRLLPEPMAHHSRSILKKAHLFLDLVSRSGSESPYVAPVMYDHASFKDLVPDLSERGHRPPLIPEECAIDDVWRMMVADALVYLPQDILVKVDRASMAWSIESRAPFLDREVVELAFSLPRKVHMPSLKGKRILWETFNELLPHRIWNRRKQGFGVPIHQWFRHQLGEDLEARVKARASPLNRAKISEMLNSHRKHQRDHGYRLWQIYVYYLWQEALDAGYYGWRTTR